LLLARWVSRTSVQQILMARCRCGYGIAALNIV
jgi:hypothetical protein